MGERFQPIKVYFSPGRDPQDTICGFVERTKKELLVSMFSFTSSAIAEKVKEALARKVVVKILVDAEQALSPAMAKLLGELRAAGAEIRADRESGYFHNKYAVSDRMAAITGSYNWTVRAEKRNRENLIIIRKKTKHANWRVDPVLAAFVGNFEEAWMANAPPSASIPEAPKEPPAPPHPPVPPTSSP